MNCENCRKALTEGEIKRLHFDARLYKISVTDLCAYCTSCNKAFELNNAYYADLESARVD